MARRRSRNLGEPIAPWWTTESPLRVAHLKRMASRTPEIDWSKSTAADLDPVSRARLLEAWRARIRAEHLGISSFAVLALDVLAAGLEGDVVSAVYSAALDEIAHTEICCRVAELYGGHHERPPAGTANLPDEPTTPAVQQALANSILVCCVAETYSTALLDVLIDEAEDPVVVSVLESIYADEIQHSRIGWSIVGHIARTRRDDLTATVATAAALSFKGVARAIETPGFAENSTDAEVTDGMRRHGLVTTREARQLFVTTLREAIVPGFAGVGVDVASAASRYDEAWIEGRVRVS
jgi:hypothetical protein